MAVQGSGGSVELQGTTLTFHFTGRLVKKVKKAVSPHVIDLADVLRLEYTTASGLKPGHLRVFLTEDQVVELAARDPFAMEFVGPSQKVALSAFFTAVVDTYCRVRPGAQVANGNSFSLRGSLRQAGADVRAAMDRANADYEAGMAEAKANLNEALSDFKTMTAPAPLVPVPAGNQVDVEHPFLVEQPRLAGPPAPAPTPEPTPVAAIADEPAFTTAGVPAPGRTVPLLNAPRYSRVRVVDLGSTDGIDGVTAATGDVVLLWGASERDENPFVTVRVRAVLDDQGVRSWLPDDGLVEIVELTRFAGRPEDLVKLARPIARPAGTAHGALQTSEGWHPLIWDNDRLHSAVGGTTDAQIATGEILCALTFAPDDDGLRAQMLAGLNAQYAHVVRNPRANPPEIYPWRRGTTLSEDDLDYFSW